MKSLILLLSLVLQQTMAQSGTSLVATSSNVLANKLYEKVSQNSGNLLICPFSLNVALGLVLQGAGGDTASELATVLGFSDANVNTKDSYKAFITGIKGDVLKVATKLFPAAGYSLNPKYVELARQYFLSDVEGVDFSHPVPAAAKINKYVEEHTNNKIHDLISPDSLSDLTKLVIVNAVHFQATWKKVFTTTYDNYFKVSPQEKVMTKMMSQTDYFDYKEDAALDAKILKMDYEKGDYSMLFILPNKEDGLPALEAKLVHTDVNSLLKNMSEAKVEVTVPKFKLEQTLNLKDTLTSMGVTQMFSTRADLKKISNGDSLYVSDVIQKTYINVHENGTEAAAATGVLIELLSASFDLTYFNAHWPFHFAVIQSQEPKIVLFEGRLVRPEESEEFVFRSRK